MRKLSSCFFLSELVKTCEAVRYVSHYHLSMKKAILGYKSNHALPSSGEDSPRYGDGSPCLLVPKGRNS